MKMHIFYKCYNKNHKYKINIKIHMIIQILKINNQNIIMEKEKEVDLKNFIVLITKKIISFAKLLMLII